MIWIAENEVPVSLVDAPFSQVFFEHLRGTHQFDHYRQYITDAEDHKVSVIDDLVTQLAETDRLQDEITSEIREIRREMSAQIAVEIKANPDEDPETIEGRVRKEYEGEFRDLRKRSAGLETTREQLQVKLEAKNKQQQRCTLPKARDYKDFQSELEILIQQWGKKNIRDKRDFVNLFVEEAVLEFPAPHWVRLTVTWNVPGWNDDILYIYRQRGACARWTDAERAILREHYETDDKIDILQLLPDRSWESIIHEAMQIKIVRSRPTKNERCPVPTGVTWQDYQFTQSMGWEPLMQGTIRVDSHP
jgi:hypothetical protein